MDKELNNKLYICLGNIGKEYADTRHNAGFIFGQVYLDYLKKEGCNLDTKEHSDYTLHICKEKHLYLLFPKTLMNLSGRAVEQFLSYTNIAVKIIAVHDDLDLALGDYKISLGKGPKTHNGINSVENALQTKDFERIRIGIENRNGLPISGLDYVLYKFTTEELTTLMQTCEKIIAEINVH